MTGLKVKAVVEVIKPQALYQITMFSACYQVQCIFVAGKIRGVFGSDFPGRQFVSSCSDESWIVVPESFCPLGLEVSMTVAGETVGVGDPSGLSFCIDIEHPWKDYFPIIGQVLDYLSIDPLWCDKTRESYQHELACFALLIDMEQRRARRTLLFKADPEKYFMQIESEQSVSDDIVPYGVIGGHQSLWRKLARVRVDRALLMEEYSLAHVEAWASEDPASLQPEIRDLSPVENSDTATEARKGALGLLDNPLMICIANAWNMCFPRPYEASGEGHYWIKEVVGMGVMGMSASAGYGTQSVVAKATCALAFASSATAFWLPRNWMTTIRVLNKVGAVACIGGILAAIGHDLPHEYKWWVAAAAFLPPAAAVVVA